MQAYRLRGLQVACGQANGQGTPCRPKLCEHARMQSMTLSNATTAKDVRLGIDVERLFADDPDILRAVAEVDRSLIRLALARSLRERLRSGVAMARLASRFRA